MSILRYLAYAAFSLVWAAVVLYVAAWIWPPHEIIDLMIWAFKHNHPMFAILIFTTAILTIIVGLFAFAPIGCEYSEWKERRQQNRTKSRNGGLTP